MQTFEVLSRKKSWETEVRFSGVGSGDKEVLLRVMEQPTAYRLSSQKQNRSLRRVGN